MPTTLEPIDIVEDSVVNDQERAQAEMMAFKPPAVKAGLIVKWFREADPNSTGYVAIMAGVGERSCKLQILNADCPWLMHSVHHIDDPTLKYRQGTRQAGAWDFMPDTKELHAKIEALEAKLGQGGKFDSERVTALVKKVIADELGAGKK